MSGKGSKRRPRQVSREEYYSSHERTFGSRNTEHFVEVCRHGVVYNTCRCPGPDKREIRVECGPNCKGATT